MFPVTLYKEGSHTRFSSIDVIIFLKLSRVSNEGKTRILEQTSLRFQSNNDRLEKELEKMGEKLMDLEERKTDLMPEVRLN